MKIYTVALRYPVYANTSSYRICKHVIEVSMWVCCRDAYLFFNAACRRLLDIANISLWKNSTWWFPGSRGHSNWSRLLV